MSTTKTAKAEKTITLEELTHRVIVLEKLALEHGWGVDDPTKAVEPDSK